MTKKVLFGTAAVAAMSFATAVQAAPATGGPGPFKPHIPDSPFIVAGGSCSVSASCSGGPSTPPTCSVVVTCSFNRAEIGKPIIFEAV